MPFDFDGRGPMNVGDHRLLLLASFLEREVPRERFDMTSWTSKAERPERDCGTAACAVGWATTVPEFRKAGLHLERLKCVVGWEMLPAFMGYGPGWPSVEAFFELDEQDSVYLFQAACYGPLPSVFDVSQRIRALVDERSVSSWQESPASRPRSSTPCNCIDLSLVRK